MKTLVFHIVGMHCPSCEKLAEMELADAPGVARAKASLRRQSVELTGEFGDKSPEALAGELTPRLTKHGFSLAHTPPKHVPKWAEFGAAIPITLALITAFLFAQRLGLGRLLTSKEMGYGMALAEGGVVSVSSCMAVVGGLVLSLSAHYAQRGEKIRPQLWFHGGRLVAFFLLGGVAGAIGSIYQPGVTGALVLGLAVGGMMIVMGVGLLDVFPWAGHLRLALPRVFGDRVHALKGSTGGVFPLLLGAATFFLPCGFTQSMQLYTLTTGSFLTGAMTMLCFALGTLPVLALLSFSTLGTRGRKGSGIFFKTAGLLVVFFGLYDILTSLVGAGLISPLLAS